VTQQAQEALVAGNVDNVTSEACVPLVAQGIDIGGTRREMRPQTKTGVDRTASPFFENHAVRFECHDHDITLL
jgi:hypothetical protein